MTSFKSKNWTPKIISIFFALIIWLYVMSEINPKVIRNENNIPVHFLNVDEMQQNGLVVKGDTDYTINVRIIGRRDAVYRISRGQIKVTADLLGYQPGINTIPIEVEELENVEIDFNPKFIRVELEKLISKEKPVKVIVEGNPDDGFVMGELEYEPKAVWIDGAESLVNSVEYVGANMKLVGEGESLEKQLPLKPLNSRGEEVRNVTLGTSHVNVRLPIYLQKTVRINPQTEIQATTGYEIVDVKVNPATVVLRGQRDVLGTIDFIDTELLILDNISENTTRNVKLILPEGIITSDISEVSINIAVEEILEKTFNIRKEDINFKNIKEGYSLDLNDVPDTFEVRVLADEETLDQLELKDIKVTIDMKELEENEYTIQPILEIPYIIERKIKDVELIPGTVNIKVVKAEE
ncbi:MAG: hypothetical protein GX214_03260 [Clostridiales bacterium]|nr:hypothetical protein [Clostridiales bacterium]